MFPFVLKIHIRRISVRDIDSLATSLSQFCFQRFHLFIAIWPCGNLFKASHKWGQIDTYMER